MREEAYKILKTAIGEHREQLLGSRQVCLGVLRDFGGREHPEVNLFADAVEANIPDRLLRSQPITQDIINALAENFAQTKLLDSHASKFTVACWADALGLYHLQSEALMNVGNVVKPAKIVQAFSQQSLQGINLYYPSQGYYAPSQITPSVKMSWTRIFWSFNGRIPRRTYWGASGILVGSFCIIALLSESVAFSGFLSMLIAFSIFPFIWMFLAIHVKRWHDCGKHGLMVLIYLLPHLGVIWAFIECGCVRGSIGDNKYGKDPN